MARSKHRRAAHQVEKFVDKATKTTLAIVMEANVCIPCTMLYGSKVGKMCKDLKDRTPR